MATTAELFAHQNMPNIIKGRALRSQYAALSGNPEESVIRQEVSPVISYVGQKGYVSTDEPTQEPINTAGGDLNLVRKPMYDALIQELQQKSFQGK